MTQINFTDINKVRLQFYGVKPQRLCSVDSNFEAIVSRALEFTNNVIDYRTQPFETKYIDHENKKRSYRPDILVKAASQQLYAVEVKPERFSLSSAFKLKHDILKKHFRENLGIELKLITETAFSESFLSNTAMLYPHKRSPLEDSDIAFNRKIRGARLTFEELQEAVITDGLDLCLAHKLVAHNRVLFNINAAWDPTQEMEVAA